MRRGRHASIDGIVRASLVKASFIMRSLLCTNDVTGRRVVRGSRNRRVCTLPAPALVRVNFPRLFPLRCVGSIEIRLGCVLCYFEAPPPLAGTRGIRRVDFLGIFHISQRIYPPTSFPSKGEPLGLVLGVPWGSVLGFMVGMGADGC